MTAPAGETRFSYVAVVEQEGCVDDGGIGHDTTRHTHEMYLESTSDGPAITEALNVEKDNPCGAFGCYSQGRTRILKVERRVENVIWVPPQGWRTNP